MRKSKIWIIVGIILLFGAFELTIHNYYEDYQAKENADKDDRWNQVYWSFGSTGIITAASSNVTLEPGRIKNCTRKIQKKYIIAGHNYRSHFSRLKTLDIGSKIWFIDVEGNRFEYKVSDIEIIKGTNVKQMEKGKWDMTLFTCTYGGQNRMALRCTLTNAVAGEN